MSFFVAVSVTHFELANARNAPVAAKQEVEIHKTAARKASKPWKVNCTLAMHYISSNPKRQPFDSWLPKRSLKT